MMPVDTEYVCRFWSPILASLDKLPEDLRRFALRDMTEIWLASYPEELHQELLNAQRALMVC
jgi:hypothetical protein